MRNAVIRIVARYLSRVASPDVKKLTEEYDDLPLECDGLTRVLHTVLTRAHVPHKVMRGSVAVLGTGTGIPLHYWIELSDDKIVDYRARMWLGSSAPHGIFKEKAKFLYLGKPVGMPILSDGMFSILTDRRVFKFAQVREPAIFVGVFLDKMDRQRLLKAFPPIHPQVFADHVTIKFRDGPTDSVDLTPYPIGKTVSMKIVGLAENDKAQAIIVQGVKTEDGRTPHITISTASGVKPEHSNEMLGSGVMPVRGGLTLRGTVAWWDGQRSRTTN